MYIYAVKEIILKAQRNIYLQYVIDNTSVSISDKKRQKWGTQRHKALKHFHHQGCNFLISGHFSLRYLAYTITLSTISKKNPIFLSCCLTGVLAKQNNNRSYIQGLNRVWNVKFRTVLLMYTCYPITMERSSYKVFYPAAAGKKQNLTKKGVRWSRPVQI